MRRPPALSAPAMPRKIVQSAPSIFSQMRRAVARLRPWNEIFSMRASRSSATASAWIVNGSTGARRKRDFVFMRNHSATDHTDQDSKRVADPSEQRGAAAIGDRVAGPGGTADDRERKVVEEDEIGGELGADRGADVRGAERAVPRVAGIEERGGV